MPLSAPPSLEKEHEEIWQLLVEVQHFSGKTGSIAEKLAKDLQVHIDKEESLALPLLGILRDIAMENSRMGSPSELPSSAHGSRRNIQACFTVTKNSSSSLND